MMQNVYWFTFVIRYPRWTMIFSSLNKVVHINLWNCFFFSNKRPSDHLFIQQINVDTKYIAQYVSAYVHSNNGNDLETWYTTVFGISSQHIVVISLFYMSQISIRHNTSRLHFLIICPVHKHKCQTKTTPPNNILRNQGWVSQILQPSLHYFSISRPFYLDDMDKSIIYVVFINPLLGKKLWFITINTWSTAWRYFT